MARLWVGVPVEADNYGNRLNNVWNSCTNLEQGIIISNSDWVPVHRHLGFLAATVYASHGSNYPCVCVCVLCNSGFWVVNLFI
jgi:hypothetical protein